MTDEERTEFFSGFLGFGGTANASNKMLGVIAGTTKASSLALRLNLIRAGISVPSFANAAHYIVAGTPPKAVVRPCSECDFINYPLLSGNLENHLVNKFPIDYCLNQGMVVREKMCERLRNRDIRILKVRGQPSDY